MKKTVLILITAGILALLTASTAGAKDYIYAMVNNAVQVIDCETDTVIKTIEFNDFIINSACSSDGKRLYLNAIHSVYAVDTVTNTLVDTYPFSTELSKVSIFGINISNDGKKLFLCCSIVKKKQNIPRLNVLPDQLVVYDIEKKQMVKNYPIPSSYSQIVVLRNDPDHLILVGQDIERISLKTGKRDMLMPFLNAKKPEDMRNCLANWQPGSPGDHGIFVNPYYDAKGEGYFFIDKNTGEMDDLRGKDVWFAYSSILSPDQKYIYAIMDELIKVDRSTGETLKVAQLETGTNYTVAVTSDGKKIYAGPGGPDISVYDAQTLELLTIIPLMSDGAASQMLSKK
jgi:WD40 repeat protein